MRNQITAALFVGLSLTACAPTTVGGPPLALSPERAAGSRVDAIAYSSVWVQADHDQIKEELELELAHCARGSSPLRLNLQVDDVSFARRPQDRGRGEHWISGLAEFVDPKSKAVVGRYPFRVSTDGYPAEFLADRKLGQAVGKTLCREAFGAG